VLFLTQENIKLPLIPVILPWKNHRGERLSFFQIYFSRFFTYTFLIIIWIIWYFLGEMSSTNCITANEKIGCSAAIWHTEFNNPIKYFFSFFTAPFFYNSSQHIRFTTISFLIFVQSFEARVGTKKIILVFLATIISVDLIGGIVSNLGYFLFPNLEIFSYMLGRSWMGASSGFMGIIGSMSHFSKYKPLLPGIVILFESWNFFINGISLSISITHVISCFVGFFIWTIINRRNVISLLMEPPSVDNFKEHAPSQE